MISWTLCSFLLLQRLEARHTLFTAGADISRRVERRISLPGVEWTTVTRESPVPARCAVPGDSVSGVRR